VENILHLISAIAPSFFGGVIASFVISILFTKIIKIKIDRFRRQSLEIKNERERLGTDISEVENEFRKIKDSECEVCTKDDPAIGCKTSHLDDKIAELRRRSDQLERSAVALNKSTRLLHTIFVSPVGKLLFYIGNSDSLQGRRQS